MWAGLIIEHMPTVRHPLMSTLVAQVEFDLATRIFSLCQRGKTEPRGYGHVFALVQLLQASIEPAQLQKLEAAYTLAVAQAFLVDDVSDIQVDTGQAVLLPTLKSLEIRFLLDAVPAKQHRAATDLVIRGSARQLDALDHEKRSWEAVLQSSRYVPTDTEHILGRSSVPLTYLDIVAIASGTRDVNSARLVIEEFLHLVQYCDDLSDWEDDLANGRITPVLAHRISRMDLAKYDEQQVHAALLREFYLDNGMEFELKFIIMEFRNFEARLSSQMPHAAIFFSYESYQKLEPSRR